jgi:hypothetical protein
MKGMAIYTDDIPDGVDIIYNTNKNKGSTKVFKPIEKDPEHPFGTVTRQRHYTDSNGLEQLSPLNIVGTDGHTNEEGAWSNWSKSLSSQILSKQRNSVAQQQLKEDLTKRQEEFDEINQLTNPAVKKRLLQSFADGCDTASVDLKAAALPRQSSHVLLPINSISEREVFAPGYNDGEPVVLIRHPHGGTFEIPELIVNNRNREAISLFGKNAVDMVGINPKVAAKLSGADFDGDAVIVIPNKDGMIITKPALRGLKDFVTTKEYPGYEGMVKMDKKTKGLEMGKASNLITDMTIKGASIDEIERAVKHSMVVIDAEKHGLDWKRSEREQGIPALKKLYQGKTTGGASTLISRAGSEARVMKRKDQVKIDPKTGEKIYAYYTGETRVDPKTGRKIRLTTPSEEDAIAKGGIKYTKWVINKKGESYIDPKTNRVNYVDRKEIDPVTGRVRYLDRVPQTATNTTRTTKMAEVKDARVLSSGHLMETTYADHANALKALANKARKLYLQQKEIPYSAEANRIYAEEVKSLDAKIYFVNKNKPLERQAQTLSNKNTTLIRQANPDMEPDTLKKIRGEEIIKARARVGAKKDPIEFTDREWEAIQNGAISKNKLNILLLNAPLEVIKERAMPRDKPLLSSARIDRGKAMARNGETSASIAKALGVSVTTINTILK